MSEDKVQRKIYGHKKEEVTGEQRNCKMRSSRIFDLHKILLSLSDQGR
jgi:hypothetical protein